MDVLTALAYERQFLDHMAPVWAALPKAMRGEFLVDPGLEEYAASIGVAARPVARLMVDRGRPIPPNLQANTPALVASYGDTKEARRFGYGPIAFIEHGAGQAYDTPHANISGSYAGGPDRADTSLFMVPNEYSAALWRRAYPGARVEIVGCPKLDTLPRRAPLKPHPVAAVSFHWDGPNVPYGGTAMHEYIPILGELARRFNVIGHAHPKGHHPEVMARVYQRAGIEFVPDFADVCRRSDVYVCDNSSTIFEYAATDRPVVLMNARHWSRKGGPGGRFWDWAHVGINVDVPNALPDAVARALLDDPDEQRAREHALSLVYAYRFGGAERAAAAVVDWMGSMAAAA